MVYVCQSPSLNPIFATYSLIDLEKVKHPVVDRINLPYANVLIPGMCITDVIKLGTLRQTIF